MSFSTKSGGNSTGHPLLPSQTTKPSYGASTSAGGCPSITHQKRALINKSTGLPATTKTKPEECVQVIRGDLVLSKDKLKNVTYESWFWTTKEVKPFRNSKAVTYTAILDGNPFLNNEVIVFAHGFSQPPENYEPFLRRLAALGYTVIAPDVCVFDVMGFNMVETLSFFAGSAKRIQTAMLIDCARAVQMAERAGAKKIHLIGHSMGGAMLLAYLKFKVTAPIHSACLLAPDVKDSKKTDLNTRVYKIKEGPNGNIQKLGKEMLQVPLLILQGDKDKIVHCDDTQELHDELCTRKGLTGFGKMKDGYHLGFQDSAETYDLPWWLGGKLSEGLIAWFNNWLYGDDVFIGDKLAKQLELSKKIMEIWVHGAGNISNTELVEEIERCGEDEDVYYSWRGVYDGMLA